MLTSVFQMVHTMWIPMEAMHKMQLKWFVGS